jgi:hypothetical protein
MRMRCDFLRPVLALVATMLGRFGDELNPSRLLSLSHLVSAPMGLILVLGRGQAVEERF